MTAASDSLPSGLSRRELAEYIDRFGVAEDQVLRDHLLSVLLAALSDSPEAGRVIFFGGTALSRTYLPDHRLSEDIDLLCAAPRGDVAAALRRVLERAVARTHGRADWRPALEDTRDSQPAVLTVPVGLRVQIQLIAAGHHPQWPTEEVDLRQRYSDVGPARLRSLTLEGFVAAKTAAWVDRGASRDLFDLHGLAELGAITPAASAVYRQLGPTGANPGPWDFSTAPSEQEWRTALAHQCRLRLGPRDALRSVADAWAAAAD